MFMGMVVLCYGLVWCWELEVCVFYVYSVSDIVSCELFIGIVIDNVFSLYGCGIGDVELIVCY